MWHCFLKRSLCLSYTNDFPEPVFSFICTKSVQVCVWTPNIWFWAVIITLFATCILSQSQLPHPYKIAPFNPPRPRRGDATPWRFFHDCSERVIDRELKFGIADPWFKPDLLEPIAFSGQVRSLTYDIIREPLHGQEVAGLSRPRH